MRDLECSNKVFLELLFILLLSAADPIPRKVLFSYTKYSGIQLRPDGREYGFISPTKNNIKNIFVKCFSCKEARQVTFEEERDVIGWSWTGVPNVILFAQDRHGDENIMLFKKNISEEAIAQNPQKSTVISNKPQVTAHVIRNDLRSARIIVGINDDNKVYFNAYMYDLLTDSMTLIIKNDRFGRFVFDHDMNVRLVIQEQPDGSAMYLRRSQTAKNELPYTSNASEWEPYLVVKSEDKMVTRPITFDKSNEHMYWFWGDENNDLGNLVTFKFDDPEHREVLYTAARAEIDDIVIHSTDKTVLALIETYHQPELFAVNGRFVEHFQYLVNFRPYDSLLIMEFSNDMSTWLLTYESADQPYDVYLYRVEQKSVEFLFNLRPQLKQYKLSRQVGFDFKARDGVVLQAYLSLPPEVSLLSAKDVPKADRAYAELGMIPIKPQKMVVRVHGGPRARDYFGFDPVNAWLTSRGYAVLQVNFRGSTGFGRRLMNAGNGEWSRKMHFDILDGVEFAIAKRIAERSQIAIMGGSYGGYETLVALTFSPEVFSCGVDIVGPSNLITLIKTVPPYWKSFYQDLIQMVGGDPETEEGRRALRERSPLFFADRVTKPLMILQGANDPRVKQQESDQFVEALQNRSIPVSYILYPDEGHGFRKEGNRLTAYGFEEQFLHTCLGGKYEPFQLGDYNTTAIVNAWAQSGSPRGLSWIAITPSLSSTPPSSEPNEALESTPSTKPSKKSFLMSFIHFLLHIQ
ncbi:unnamed protein product [Cylicocyclus nassatus]|uniref:Peptidase S9 prolyl oligopeptidase catalytic domain-containing protein n=1 Tax=Cylicocyclus nassatus TaxID=53992 RepID=A0AA36DM37_CYLNA|nr:unnamed protein product [Cylicocyclus nassatus]